MERYGSPRGSSIQRVTVASSQDCREWHEACASLRLPPPTRFLSPRFSILPVGTPLVRIFDPTDYDATAIGFRSFGPFKRLNHHPRLTGSAASDPERGIYYAALNLDWCLVEVWEDAEMVETGERQIAQPRLGAIFGFSIFAKTAPGTRAR